MLVRQFKFKRNNDKGGFQWTAESEIERPEFHRGFHGLRQEFSGISPTAPW
jgi:hypothetical protein